MQYYDKSDYLAHYGVLGMKWGVRRYQNKDGSLTEEGKRRRQESVLVRRNKPYTDAVNDIVDSLSLNEKALLGAENNKKWIEKQHERETLVNKANTFVTKVGDVPVSFVEIWTNGGRIGQMALATRNGSRYRGKGYASKTVDDALRWIDRYMNRSIDELEWIADKDNAASIALAQQYGFVEGDPRERGRNWSDDVLADYTVMYRPVRSL